jgi:hypothetical protein
LQYRLALAVANMEDGLSGLRPPAERLDVLQKHQAAWAALKGVQRQEHIPMDADGYWELSGKCVVVWTRGSAGRSSQLFQHFSTADGPDYYRILSHHYRLTRNTTPCRLEDTLAVSYRRFHNRSGPGLARCVGTCVSNMTSAEPRTTSLTCLHTSIVELGSSDTSTSIRILSMETGHPHSKTTTPLLQTQKSTRPSPVCYHVRIRGDYLGILYTESQDCELRIWHWKTGQLCLVRQPLCLSVIVSDSMFPVESGASTDRRVRVHRRVLLPARLSLHALH